MFNFRDNSSPAERYNAVFDTALDRVSKRHGTIRNSSFAAEGELAQKLARIGAPVVDPMLGEAQRHMILDVSYDYVAAGGNIALDLLERVIHPSSSSYGPGNFSVTPCDSIGLDLKDVKVPGVLDQKSSDIILRERYWLGMSREEIFRVAAMGIGLAITKEAVTLKQSVKVASKEAESDRWLERVENVIGYAAEMALSAIQFQNTGNSYKSAFVRVETMAGQGAEGLTETPTEVSRFALG